MTKLAFLGLGAMGRRMARHLVVDGFDVALWNRSPVDAEGLPAQRARTPAEAAEGAEIVMSMVTDDTAARDVWLGDRGAVAGLGEGSLAVEMSTVSPDWIAELDRAVDARTARLVDAPVAGSRPQAEARQLVFLVGGGADDVARFDPVAASMGRAVVHAGDTGKGAVLKLLVNGLLAVQTAAMGELLSIADASGIAPDKAVDLLANIPVTSPAAAVVGGQIARGEHDPLFTVDLMLKDLGYLVGAAPAGIMSGTRDRFAAAAARGLGSRHISAVALV